TTQSRKCQRASQALSDLIVPANASWRCFDEIPVNVPQPCRTNAWRFLNLLQAGMFLHAWLNSIDQASLHEDSPSRSEPFVRSPSLRHDSRATKPWRLH